jgi:methyl-accepting chemotaxis protein
MLSLFGWSRERGFSFSLSAAVLVLAVALGLLLAGQGGLRLWAATSDRQDMQALAVSNETANRLLAAAHHWAMERGLTNMALNQPERATPAQIASILEVRRAGDAQMTEVEAALALRSDIHPGWLASYLSAHNILTGERRLVDTALTLPRELRSERLRREWLDRASTRIEAS